MWFDDIRQLGFSNLGIPAHFLNPESRDWQCCALILGFRGYKNRKLHADKAKFGAYFCHNFVEFVAYILRCLCVFDTVVMTMMSEINYAEVSIYSVDIHGCHNVG